MITVTLMMSTWCLRIIPSVQRVQRASLGSYGNAQSKEAGYDLKDLFDAEC